MSDLKLEICTPSFTAALTAQKGGANRIELCAALESGGITPSYATIALCKAQLTIPVYVLIRARGGDFCYSEEEMQVMLRDIELCSELGVDGVVCGALSTNATVHITQTKRFLAAAKNMDFTFHRAFDRCQNPHDTLRQLIDLGISRILTSGQQPNALLGTKLLAQLIQVADNQITIMPGAGINAENIQEIKAITQAKEFHLSAKKTIISPFNYQNILNDKNDYEDTHLESVIAAVRALQQ